NTGRVELGGEVDGLVVEGVAGGGRGIGVGVHSKIRSRFGPNVVGFGGMDARTGVEVSRGKRNLRRVRVAGSHEAVEERRSRVAENLLRTVGRVGLDEVVIFHRDHKDVADPMYSFAIPILIRRGCL